MENTEMLDNTSEAMEGCDSCETTCPECVDEENGMPNLPPGIKTEAVLMLLGNLSKALGDVVASINGTVTAIITEGNNAMMNDEGEMSDGND